MPPDDQEASREVAFRSMAENLTVHRVAVEGDTVGVRTTTTETEHLVEEMLRHETADIQRISVDREIEAMPQVQHQGDLTIVPVVKEILVLRRQLVLVEEIHIRRVSTTKPFKTTVTLREQRADITREPSPDVAVADGLPPNEKE